MGVLHSDLAGEVGVDPGSVAVAELVDALVIPLEGDEDVARQRVDHRTEAGTRVAVGTGRLRGQVCTAPGAEVVVDLVDPLVLPQQVDVELFRGGMDEAHGSGDGVVDRGQAGEIGGTPGAGVAGDQELDALVTTGEQDVVVPDQGVHERLGTGARVDGQASDGREVLAAPTSTTAIQDHLPDMLTGVHEDQVEVTGGGIVVASGV